MRVLLRYRISCLAASNYSGLSVREQGAGDRHGGAGSGYCTVRMSGVKGRWFSSELVMKRVSWI